MTHQKTIGKKWYKTGRGRLMTGIAAAVCIGIGAQAIAQSRPAQHVAQFVTDGGAPDFVQADFRSGHRFGAGRGSMLDDMTDAEMDGMIARGVAHAAIELDATDAQRDEITQIILDLVADLRPVPDGFRAAGTEIRELLLAEEVDAAALEALRADRIAEADRVSREMITAMTRISNILTPEQRQTAADRMAFLQEMRERRRTRD
ncbi:Spy/CpxP family protein refolding chaperone [Roseobacter sp. CCS2]|uniref:Spy/CpxP family protein refolding chaperone n=1 Tax=Roseobacter sp. CCS2 TaxID=391593 RepID=UPI0000F3FDB6|nr:Spy/CpxP family protein refolding chaperone [Roseobacter sp. CCS2]EBA10714.1 hypothetical protein RCCS2_02940 [Roseobacter sp. CCS2]